LDSSLQRPRPRARRSQYRRGFPRAAALLGALLLLLVAGGAVFGVRVASFLHSVANVGDPGALAQQEFDPQPGSIPYKLKHAEPVNLLLLGYGGAENEAPWLTDSMMVLSIESATHRVAVISLPRDLLVEIDAWPGHKTLTQKLNVAFEIGNDDASWPGKRPEFTRNKDAGGKLAMATVTAVTGLRLDGYAGVDFKAFRDVVDALGGVQVCLDTPLDDNQYPDYHNGYIPGGIHFSAGCQQVNGERALQLARSRHAKQPEQMSDFGRSRRQQLLMNAIRKKAVGANALAKAPALMDALQKNYRSNLGLADLKAVYEYTAKLPDGALNRVAITSADLVDEFYMRKGSCGDFYADVLCPQDPSFRTLQSFLSHVFIDRKVIGEAAPLVIANASVNTDDLGERVTMSLRQLGLKFSSPLRRRALDRSLIYDYSGGRYPLTAQWLSDYFGATVVPATTASPPPPTGAAGDGLVVVLGRDYALRWLGR